MVAWLTMKRTTVTLAALAIFFSASGIRAESADETAIKTMLQTQARAWNRGDIAGFMASYENSTRTAYVGAKIVKGYDAILAGYRQRYPGPAGMGEVAFSDFNVRPIGESVAIVIGRFALTRDAAEGGSTSGIFTLVLRKGSEGWKIIHDHTS